ncbi:MAG: 50S ribosomal protein L6 [Candidatus Zixiibacteriota bacterium]
MSRVGKQPVVIPAKTTVNIAGQIVNVAGPMGKLSVHMHPDVSAKIENNEVLVSRKTDMKKHKALHGLTRALIQNAVIGVSSGYQKVLEIIGVGFRADVKGSNLILWLGFSHPIGFTPPDEIKISVRPKENKIYIDGIDKELVGQVAAKIRSLRKPEPYKGKGIRYSGEVVQIKAGKTAGK